MENIISKNFINHETISNGPLRTVFRLDYEDWDGPHGKISEHKIISLDKGSNLSKIEEILKELIRFLQNFPTREQWIH